MEVTKYVKPKKRQIVDHNASEGIEPRNSFIALGEELSMSEASITACAKGECDSNVPGSESMVGKRQKTQEVILNAACNFCRRA